MLTALFLKLFPPSLIKPAKSIGPSDPKMRIMYLLDHYPEVSETYMQTELRILGEEYEIFIVAAHRADICFNPEGYPFTELNSFSRLVALVREIKPQILHSHTLYKVDLLARLSEATGVPFTIRAHSGDAIVPGSKTAAVPRHIRNLHKYVNDDRCLGIVVLPFTRDLLTVEGKVKGEKLVPAPPVVDFCHFYDRAPNGDGVMNVGACLPKKKMTDFIDVASRFPQKRFSLYPMGHLSDRIGLYNKEYGSPAVINEWKRYSTMPAEYKKHNWLLYTACPKLAMIGWPMAVVEAQASGAVVCIPGVRPDIRDYVGEGGFVFNTLEEATEILSSPPPSQMRDAAFDHASGMDFRKHKHCLTDLWQAVGQA